MDDKLLKWLEQLEDHGAEKKENTQIVQRAQPYHAADALQ
jgi:hypothetical protein